MPQKDSKSTSASSGGIQQSRLRNSLRAKMTLWSGLLMAVASLILIVYSAMTLRQTAIDDAQNEALAVAASHAQQIRAELDAPLLTARTMAHALEAIKSPANPIAMTRDQVNGMLRQVLSENPSYLGTYTLWEPNAFDGLDAEYQGKPAHDNTGRFIPYWVRGADGTIHVEALKDYEVPGTGDWYLQPRNTQKEYTIAPYIYSIQGTDTMMATFTVPILVNGKFYGITGVDAPIAFTHGIVDSIDLYGGKAQAILLTDAGTLIAVRQQPELSNQPATQLYPDFEQLKPRLTAGEVFISPSPDGQYVRVFSPIAVGEVGTHWSLGLIIPVSEITAAATTAAVRQVVINAGLIVLALFVLWLLNGRVVRPIRELTNIARLASEGDLTVTVKSESSDETGVLASAFNIMTAKLRDSINTLEQRVADRTKDLEAAQAVMAKRAAELQSVAEIATKSSQATDANTILQTVVDLTKSSYNLYHAHVYLLDENKTKLVLAAGAGEAGRKMVSEKRTIAFDHQRSLVARAARTRVSAISNDVTREPDFLPNPLLPNTKSEMAVPILVGDDVLGVLDVQADQVNRFTGEDAAIITTLSRQIGVSLQNIRSYERAEQSLRDAETLYVIGQGMAAAKDQQEIVAAVAENIGLPQINRAVMFKYEYDAAGELETIEATGNWHSGKGTEPTPVGRRYPAKVFTIVHFSSGKEPAFFGDTHNDKRVDPASAEVFKAQNIRAFASLPVWDEMHQIGTLLLESEEPIPYTGKELLPFQSIIQQLGVALDKQALLEQTVQGEARLRVLVENAPEAILVIDLTTGLFTEPNENAVKLFGLSREELVKVGPAQMSPLTQPDGRDSTEKAMEKINEAMQGAAPVFEWTHRNAQDQDIPCEVRLVRLPGDRPLVRSSVTNITERKRTQEIIAKRAIEMETVSKVSSAVSTILDVQELLQTVVDLTKTNFNLYHAHIYLLNEAKNALVLAAGAGDVGKQMVEQKRTIQLTQERSLVVQAALTKQGQIVNDVTKEPDFLPNPLLPETQSEMSIPMMLGNDVIGVFDVQSNEIDRFTAEDVRIQSSLAAQVTIALQNARLFDQTRAALVSVQESQSALNEAMVVAGMASWKLSFETFRYTFDDRLYDMLGTTAEEEGGYEISTEEYSKKYYHPEDAGMIAEAIQAALQNPDPQNFKGSVEFRVIRKDGQIRYMLANYRLVVNEQGKPIGSVGSFLDITERKLAEEAIRAAQQRAQTILDSATVPMIISRMSDGKVLYANQKVADIGHARLEDVLSRNAGDFFADPHVWDKLMEMLRQQGSVSNLEAQVQRGGGGTYWALLSARSINFQDELCLICSYLDITERKQDEEDLRRSEAQLSEALKIAKLGYFEYDVAGDLFLFNDQFYALFHTTVEQVGGYQISSAQYAQTFVHPDDLPLVGAEIAKALASTDRHYNRLLEHRICYADGGVGYISVNVQIDRDEQGQILRYYGANQDITERKQIEEAIARRAAELATVAEVSTTTATTLEPDRLLQSVVDLTKERFGLYHAHIYLLDADGDGLTLTAGAGEVGRTMVAQGWQIPLDREQSLVARAARTRQGVIINDVRAEPDFMPNELLPETRAEMAVPLIAGDKVLGVFDVQSDRPGSFSPEDVNIHATLAAQVGIALQNARLFDQTQAALAQSDKLFAASRSLTQAADLQELVKTVASTLDIPRVNRAVLSTFNYDSTDSLESMDIIASWWNGVGQDVAALGTHYPLDVIRAMPMFVSPTPVFFSDTLTDERVDKVTLELVKRRNLRAVAVLPLHLGARQIGALILAAEEVHNFSPDEIRLFAALAPQIAAMLENRRQFERTQKQAERESTLNVISQKIQGATTVEAALQIAARELGRALGAPLTIAQIGLKDRDNGSRN